MKRAKVVMVSLLFALTLVFAVSQVKAQTFQCFWPDPGGAVGYVITNVDNFGAMLIFTYNPVGDIFAYTVDSAGPKTVNFAGGGMLPAYFYGQYKGNDSLTGKPIYDFYISGSGVQGSFAYCCTQVW